jgi:ankyrin repeat protein
MLAIEHEREEIIDYLLDIGVDIEKTESRCGNTSLHIACKKSDHETVNKLFNKQPKLCLMPNY